MNYLEKQVDNAGILRITLNRPDKLNALNQDLLNALLHTFEEAKQDKRVRAIMITGAGKAFCAGADITQLAQCDAITGYQFAVAGQNVFNTLEQLGKPSLAVVNGVALGGGCELAMAATFRIASVDAKFAQPEVKLGVIPGYGGTQRLSRLIGKGRALDLCLTGRTINAGMAYDFGLVSEVTEKEALMDSARTLLHSVLSVSPHAVAQAMSVIHRGYDLPLDEALHLEALHFAQCCANSEKTEGTQAFLDKRAPDYYGIHENG